MKVRVYGNANLSEKPVISKVIIETHAMLNIVKADVDETGSDLIIDVPEREYSKVLEALRATGLTVSPLEKPIVKDEEKCTNCGACLSICPISIFKCGEGGRIELEYERCVQCGSCLTACPFVALRLSGK